MRKIAKPSCLLKGCLIVFVLPLILLYVINIAALGFPLTNAYSKWQATKPQNYTVLVRYGTFEGTYNTSREAVKNGVLESSTNTGFSRPAIDRLFDKITDCVFFPLGFLSCQVEYDPDSGYPNHFRENDLDLGQITEIAEFIPDS